MQITKNILLRQTHPDLLHDAFVAEVSSQKGAWNQERDEVFLAQYLALTKSLFILTQMETVAGSSPGPSLQHR